MRYQPGMVQIPNGRKAVILIPMGQAIKSRISHDFLVRREPTAVRGVLYLSEGRCQALYEAGKEPSKSKIRGGNWAIVGLSHPLPDS